MNTVEEINIVLQNFKKQKTDSEIFYNLCFCLMAPQTTFKKNNIAISNLRTMNFYEKEYLQEDIEKAVYCTRFFRNKSRNLIEMKKNFNNVLQIIKSNLSVEQKRIKLVESVRGLGYKTSSHFLRNLGIFGLAIIDTHILKFLKQDKFPTTAKKYLILEQEFIESAKSRNITVELLDALVWKEYSGTKIENFIY